MIDKLPDDVLSHIATFLPHVEIRDSKSRVNQPVKRKVHVPYMMVNKQFYRVFCKRMPCKFCFYGLYEVINYKENQIKCNTCGHTFKRIVQKKRKRKIKSFKKVKKQRKVS